MEEKGHLLLARRGRSGRKSHRGGEQPKSTVVLDLVQPLGARNFVRSMSTFCIGSVLIAHGDRRRRKLVFKSRLLQMS